MRSFIEHLYIYAQENQVPRYLQTCEYRRAIHGLEEGWEAFRSALTEEQARTLDSLRSQGEDVELLEDEATFAAGLSMGLDLGRL